MGFLTEDSHLITNNCLMTMNFVGNLDGTNDNKAQYVRAAMMLFWKQSELEPEKYAFSQSCGNPKRFKSRYFNFCSNHLKCFFFLSPVSTFLPKGLFSDWKNESEKKERNKTWFSRFPDPPPSISAPSPEFRD